MHLKLDCLSLPQSVTTWMSKGMIMALYFFLFSISDKILKRWD